MIAFNPYKPTTFQPPPGASAMQMPGMSPQPGAIPVGAAPHRSLPAAPPPRQPWQYGGQGPVNWAQVHRSRGSFPGSQDAWNQHLANMARQARTWAEGEKLRQQKEQVNAERNAWLQEKERLSGTAPFLGYAPWLSFDERMSRAMQQNPYWKPSPTQFGDWWEGMMQQRNQQQSVGEANMMRRQEAAQKRSDMLARQQEAKDWRRNMEEQMRRELQYRELRKRYFPDEFRFQEEDQQDEAEQARRDIERRRLLQAYASRGMYDTPEMHRALDEMNTLRGG